MLFSVAPVLGEYIFNCQLHISNTLKNEVIRLSNTLKVRREYMLFVFRCPRVKRLYVAVSHTKATRLIMR